MATKKAKTTETTPKATPKTRVPVPLDEMLLGRNFYRVGERIKVRDDIFEITGFLTGSLVIQPLDKER